MHPLSYVSVHTCLCGFTDLSYVSVHMPLRVSTELSGMNVHTCLSGSTEQYEGAQVFMWLQMFVLKP